MCELNNPYCQIVIFIILVVSIYFLFGKRENKKVHCNKCSGKGEISYTDKFGITIEVCENCNGQGLIEV